jgi:hypothetical protein
LVCSTLFTLVVVPLLFSLVMDARTLFLRTLFGKHEEQPVPSLPQLSTDVGTLPAEVPAPVSTV